MKTDERALQAAGMPSPWREATVLEDGATLLARPLTAASSALGLGWLRLAICSLLLAGGFAGLVAIARTPAIQSLVGLRYFRISLVGHVNFSLSVWCLAFAAAVWALAPANSEGGRARLPWLGPLGLGSAVAGTVVMAIVCVLGLGQPALVDYLPALEHPAFGVGLGLFLGGVALQAIAFLLNVRGSAAELGLFRLSAWAYLASLVSLLAGVTVGWRGDWAIAASGGGHLMQVVNATMLVGIWIVLLPGHLPARSRAAIRLASLPLFLPMVVIPSLYLLPGPLSRTAISVTNWSAVAVMMTVALVAIGERLWRQRPMTVAAMPVLLSVLLFASGFAIALLGLQGDTRVTAHYHGTVGAVTLAFMALSYRLLPALTGRSMPRLARHQPMAYGLGLMILVIGLYWASSFGGQRKVYDTFAHQSGLFGPILLFGAGSVLAILGGAAYVGGLAYGLRPVKKS
jgi:hypothetical protein